MPTLGPPCSRSPTWLPILPPSALLINTWTPCGTLCPLSEHHLCELRQVMKNVMSCSKSIGKYSWQIEISPAVPGHRNSAVCGRVGGAFRSLGDQKTTQVPTPDVTLASCHTRPSLWFPAAAGGSSLCTDSYPLAPACWSASRRANSEDLVGQASF